MISLIQDLAKEFNYRHDFEYEDLNFLSKKYTTISFDNIPEAWVCQIDIFLSKINDIQNIQSIFQTCGFLIVNYVDNKNINSKDLKTIIKLKDQLCKVDIDLHDEFWSSHLNKNGIILN